MQDSYHVHKLLDQSHAHLWWTVLILLTATQKNNLRGNSGFYLWWSIFRGRYQYLSTWTWFCSELSSPVNVPGTYPLSSPIVRADPNRVRWSPFKTEKYEEGDSQEDFILLLGPFQNQFHSVLFPHQTYSSDQTQV